jgi:hypothetical protein
MLIQRGMMTGTGKHRHYLSRFYGANDNPEARFRRTSLFARAIFPQAGIKAYQGMSVKIVGLQEQGAILQVADNESLPEHFYLCLGENEIFFTCARRDEVKAGLRVAFAEPEDTFFIDALARISLPMATFQKMRGSCPAVIQSRMRRPGQR